MKDAPDFDFEQVLDNLVFLVRPCFCCISLSPLTFW